MPSQTEANAIRAAIRAVVATVRECGEVPAGTLYAALMTHGCTKANFDTLMRELVAANILSVESNVYRMAKALPMAAALFVGGAL